MAEIRALVNIPKQPEDLISTSTLQMKIVLEKEDLVR